MSLGAGLLGLIFPGICQALTGRWRAALVFVAALPLVLLAAIAWPPLVWLAVLVLPASAIDAMRAARRGARARGKYLALAVVTFAWIVVQAEVLKRYVASTYKVPSSSMMPTFEIGDHFLVEKLSLLWSPPARGELFVFEVGSPPRLSLGRVVAIAGDEIAVRDNTPVLGGKAAASTRLGPAAFVDGDHGATVTVFEESLGGRRYRTFHRAEPEDAERGRDAYPRLEGGCASESARIQLAPNAGGTACVVPAGTVFYLGDDRWNSNDSRYQGAVPVAQLVGRIRGLWLPGASADGTRWSRLGGVE